jgi:hypothetical protein
MDIQFGSVEAIAQAASYSDNAAAVLDLDTAAGYAQVGAKGGVGTSLGAKIRTVLNGVMKDAITIVASGLTITLLAGSTLAAQAVTGTTANFTAGLSTTAVTATGVISSSAGIIGRLDAAGISYGLQVLNVGGGSQIGAVGFSVSSATENGGNPVYKAAIGIQRSDVNGFGDLLFMVRNSNDTTTASLADLKMRLSTAGVLTVAGGINVTSGGITSTQTSGVVLYAGSATTGNLWHDLQNTSGRLRVGIEGSVAGSIWAGGNAYAGFIGTVTNQPLDFATNGTRRGGFSAAGAFDLTGAFGCNGNTPQGKYASGGTLAGVVAALVANGVCSN